jgi:hypothetical protein
LVSGREPKIRDFIMPPLYGSSEETGSLGELGRLAGPKMISFLGCVRK